MLQGVRTTLKLKLLEHKLINPTICNLYFTKKNQTKGVSMHEKEQCFHDSFI